MIRRKKKLVLDNGQVFEGILFGADCDKVSEVVFNTSVVGYQEIVSDPSYAGQIVVMTYPLAGNYGITDEDYEAKQSYIDGIIVRECCDTPSNFRLTRTLEEELEENGIPCISEVDTRMLAKAVRRAGRPRGAIVDADMPVEDALALIRNTPTGERSVRRVSCRKRWLTRTPNHRFSVVAVDCGIKHSIIRLLASRGCNVTIVPFDTAAGDVLAYNPDGVLLSNGPDNVPDVPEVSALFHAIKGRIPVLGTGLGAEIIGTCYGAVPKWMGCGIHGDHPVRELESGRIETAVMNQSYCFESLEGTGLTPTHVSVPEGYAAGFINREDKVFGVQFQIEAAPGPRDNVKLIDIFIKMMEENKDAEKN